LGLILVFFPEKTRDAGSYLTEEEQTDEEVPEEGHSESKDYKDVVPEEILEEEIALEKPSKVGGKLFVVIDDVGNNLADLEYFLDIAVPVTFAVMPERIFSSESVKMIKNKGFEYILHQPMEPEGEYDPGPGAIYTDMSPDQIYKVLESNLKDFPGVKGINNHMGSKATADRKIMTAILTYLKRNEMFFLDSVTTHKSVAAVVAAEVGVPYAKRNVIFLDNEGEKDSIHKAFRTGTEIAAAKGTAVMIGHLKSHALVDVLQEMAPELSKSGYTFHGISSLFEGSGNQ
jgi:hypothetical protein